MLKARLFWQGSGFRLWSDVDHGRSCWDSLDGHSWFGRSWNASWGLLRRTWSCLACCHSLSRGLGCSRSRCLLSNWFYRGFLIFLLCFPSSIVLLLSGRQGQLNPTKASTELRDIVIGSTGQPSWGDRTSCLLHCYTVCWQRWHRWCLYTLPHRQDTGSPAHTPLTTNGAADRTNTRSNTHASGCRARGHWWL